MHQDRTTTLAVAAALLGNTLIALTKLAAALLSGSSAMLAQTAHSLADGGNQLILLLGLRLGAKPPDPEHPFGHGKERYFWTFIAAMSLFIIGATFSVMEGVRQLGANRLLSGARIAYLVLAISLAFETGAIVFAWRGARPAVRRHGLWGAVRRTKDPVVFTVFYEGAAAIVGLGLAAAGLVLWQLTGNAVYDAVATMLIGVLLGGVALLLGAETRSLLLGEAASARTRQHITEAVRAIPEVREIVRLLTMHLGPEDILVTLEVHLRDDLTTDELEDAVDRIEESIKARVPAAGSIFVEPRSGGRRERRPPPP